MSDDKPSRQRAWQLRHIDKGLCINCSNVAVAGNLCLDHALKKRERQRLRRGSKKRYHSLTYRLTEEQKTEPQNT